MHFRFTRSFWLCTITNGVWQCLQQRWPAALRSSFMYAFQCKKSSCWWNAKCWRTCNILHGHWITNWFLGVRGESVSSPPSPQSQWSSVAFHTIAPDTVPSGNRDTEIYFVSWQVVWMELLIFKPSQIWGDKHFTCQQVAHVKAMIISLQSVCITIFAFIPRKVKLQF